MMRVAILLTLLVASTAQAKRYPGQGELVEFKVVSQTPSAFTSRALFANLDTLIPSVEACGSQKHDKRFAYGVDLEIAADGFVSHVTLDKKLDAAAVECLTRAITDATFTKPRKATKLTLALVYQR